MIARKIFLLVWIILISNYGIAGAMDDESRRQPGPEAPLSEAQGKLLLQIARQAIAERLRVSRTVSDTDILAAARENPALQKLRGTFVTLTLKGNLRGCIGSLTPVESILDGVQRNAVNAAFNDPRFNLLTREEFEKIAIEVSILSEPQPLPYEDSTDLLAKLRVHVDGVIIRKGSASATFLPQVWAQLPRPELFLEHLCRKAGLAGDAWQSDRLDVFTYRVQYFEEHP